MTWLHDCKERGLTEVYGDRCDRCDAERPAPKQQEVLTYIAEHWRKEGGPPTHMEIQRHFGFSSANSVATHIAQLKKKGVLEDSRLLYPTGMRRRIIEALAP